MTQRAKISLSRDSLTLLEPNKEAGHCDSTHHPYVVDGMGGRQVKDTYYPVIHHVEKCRDMSSSCFGPPPWPATQSPSMIGRKCYYEDLTWLDPLFKQYTITAQTILHKFPNPLGYQSYRPVSLAQPGPPSSQDREYHHEHSSPSWKLHYNHTRNPPFIHRSNSPPSMPRRRNHHEDMFHNSARHLSPTSYNYRSDDTCSQRNKDNARGGPCHT